MLKTITKLSLISLASFLIYSVANCSPFRLPDGNYAQSCRGCKMVHHTLACMCPDRNNKYFRTKLVVPNDCIYIQNINSNLQCTAHTLFPSRHHFPEHHPRHPKRHFMVRDFNAGLIFNNDQAKTVCPGVCRNHHAKWTKQWHTTSYGQMSVCQCRQKH